MNRKVVLAMVAASAGFVLHAEFMAGFSRVDMTPPIGTELAGYPRKRVSDGIIDTLDINAVAFSDGTNKAVVISGGESTGFVDRVSDYLSGVVEYFR